MTETRNGIMTEENEVNGLTAFVCIVLAGLLMTYCYFTAAKGVEKNNEAKTTIESEQ